MNILHIVPYFYPAAHFGGTPEAVLSLARAQSQLGYKITVLTTDASLDQTKHSDEIEYLKHPHSQIQAQAEIDHLQILYIKNHIPKLANTLKVFTPNWTHSSVIKHIPSEIDILHFHEVNIGGYAAMARWAKTQNIPFVVSTHGSFKPPTHTFLKKMIHAVYDPFCQRGWFKHCSAYFTTSRIEKEKLEVNHIQPSLIHLLPFGQPEMNRQVDQLPFDFQENESMPTLLYFGRLNQQKGIELVFRSFELLWEEGCYARLVFCGPNEGGISLLRKWNQKSRIPMFIYEGIKKEPGIYICPPVERKHLSALLKKIDLTLCPSPYESFGLSLVESLQFRIPVAATDRYGCLDFLPKTITGLSCVSNSTPMKFKQAIQKQLNSHSKPSIDSQHLLPSWKDIASQTINVYQNVEQEIS